VYCTCLNCKLLFTTESKRSCVVVQVTDDITDLTCADFLSDIGKRTPVALRFSTVTHERGSPESLRDVRGFSVRCGFQALWLSVIIVCSAVVSTSVFSRQRVVIIRFQHTSWAELVDMQFS